MTRPKIGIRLESLGLPLRKGLATAARLGVAGVQVDALGDLDPRQLSQTGRREFHTLLKTHNLELSALGCPLPRGLDVPEGQQERIDRLRLALTLSYDLGPGIVVAEAGPMPDPKAQNDPRAVLMREALEVLGRHGDRVGAVLALETGLESGPALRNFLDTFDTGGLGANLDPANLLMHGFDPYEAAKTLREKIAHTHAKDARASSASRPAQEVPLGHGDIDWIEFLGALEEFEYRGYLTIERESGTDRVGDIAGGVKFLRQLMG